MLITSKNVVLSNPDLSSYKSQTVIMAIQWNFDAPEKRTITLATIGSPCAHTYAYIMLLPNDRPTGTLSAVQE